MTTSPLFWLFAFALVTATLLLLVLPLLRRTSAANAPADQAAVTSIYRDYKRQIEADYAARTITEAERDASLADLTTRLGQELGQDPSANVVRSERSRWIAAMVLVACVPVVAGLLYFTLGNPAAVSGAATASAESPHGSGTGDDPKMAAIVDALAKKLQANPDDGEGWAMLGRSYRVLGRFDASAMAYAEAAKRLPPNAVVYTEWAEAVAQAQGKTLTGQPTELLDRALAVDPNYQKALALAGSAALERNDNATAAALWKRLRATLPADSPNLAEVDEALARVGVTPPAKGAAAAPAPSPAPAMVAKAPAPSADAPAKGPATAGGTASSIEGRVEIDPKLAGKIGPGDTVFILARDPDGSRMPLAALKLTGADLPKSFALSDAMAMSEATTISKAKRIVVEARVSKSGNAMLQPGDLSGTSAPVAPGARDVRVTIDRVVP